MLENIPNTIQNKLVNEIHKHIKSNYSKTPLMINISGCTGSGKSTWASLITESFRRSGSTATHVSEDDFLQPRDYRESLPKEKWENHENWLRLDLMKEVITNLSRNESSRYFSYLRSTGKFSLQEKVVEPADIIIFESSIFGELFDVVILLEVDDKILLSRKLKRDSTLRNEETIRKYHKIQLAFWNRYKPKKPDYIIDNNNYENPKLEIVSKNE